MQEFLKTLSGNAKCHITNRFKVYTVYYPKNTDMYFVCWTASFAWSGKWWRVVDADIVLKKYFCIDIDVRKTLYEKTWKVITHEQLMFIGRMIAEQFSKDDQLKDYAYIVCSGNWFHIYYIIQEKKYDKVIYRLWVSAMYDHALECIQQSDNDMMKMLDIDYSTANISRLFRLPETVNTKASKEFNLPETICTIVAGNGRSSSIDIETLGTARQYQEEQKKYRFTKKVYNESNHFDTIQSIPTHVLFTWFTGIPIHTDWKNFISPKDNKFIGCFYDEKTNLIINTGTHYLWAKLKAYGPRSYVKHEVLQTQNNKLVYEWFKNNNYVE